MATVGSIGGLSGCSQLSSSIGGTGGSTDSIETVPAGSQYVLEVDFTVLYDDEALREGINEELKSVRDEMQSDEVPESVTAALDQVETEAALDPRSMSRAILSGTYEDDAEYDQAAYTFWTEWSEEDLLATIEEEGPSYTEESYGDTTVYAPEQQTQMGTQARLAVLEEGVFTVGTRSQVEATIDTHNGDADPISGEVRNGYDASTDGHLRYAFDVVASEVPASTGAQFDTSAFRDVTYGYGSLSKDGSDRVASLGMKTAGEETATDISDIVQGLLVLAEQQVENSDATDTEELLTALEATDVSADGSAATVTHTRPASDFAAVLTPVLLSFVVGTGTAPSERPPQVSFSFEYAEDSGDQGQVAITHTAGDTVPASQLSLQGTGFKDVDGVDQIQAGPWQGTTTDGNIVAGDTVSVGVSSDYELSLVWESESAGTSAMLATDQGPDA